MKWNNQSPTVQMLGRWQPWHEGHLALFKRAHTKTGQVCIMVRDVGGTENNPFDFSIVQKNIVDNLTKVGYIEYNDYIVQLVPNIVNITYGRDVGYKIEQEVFDDAIHSISATKIRKDMGY
jgi:nicotinamide mononucleotide adenylyltransferase